MRVASRWSDGMAQMRTIEIDFDIHQMIELERKGFDEPENVALRRLLKLPTKEEVDPAPSPDNKKSNIGLPWSGKGVELPHGTELRMEYNGKVHYGKIEDGIWIVEGRRSTSPSDAAGSVATTKHGTRPSLNGWNYWEIKRPSDSSWRSLKNLKKQRMPRV